jgi:acetoacetate decarboxylase
MKISDVKQQAFAMPLASPSALKIDYKMKNREYLIITYETDIELLREIVPEPLKVVDNIVKFEFMNMPDAYGFGSFSEAGQIIDVEYQGVRGSYSNMLFLNDLAPIAAGREIWGFPKKYGQPSLKVDVDTLVGQLRYNSLPVAVGTMAYKYNELDTNKLEDNMQSAPNFLLKIIPHANGRDTSLCQLVKYHLKDMKIHGAWNGPGALELFNHVLAPVAKLPVRRVVDATHLVADVTLGFGEIVYDYLKD